eukprot:527125_1
MVQSLLLTALTLIPFIMSLENNIPMNRLDKPKTYQNPAFYSHNHMTYLSQNKYNKEYNSNEFQTKRRLKKKKKSGSGSGSVSGSKSSGSVSGSTSSGSGSGSTSKVVLVVVVNQVVLVVVVNQVVLVVVVHQMIQDPPKHHGQQKHHG